VSTTASLVNGAGLSVQFVVAIEGYEYLLTDGNTNEAIDAWDATDWSGRTALGGLFIDWSRMKQNIAPWDTRIQPMSVTLSVMDCTGLDTLGVDMHATAAGNTTQLDAAIIPTSTTVTVKSTSSFSASGAAYVGQERFEYSAKAGTSFTTSSRGTLAPFKAGGDTANHFARNHRIPNYNNVTEAKVPPDISSTPRNWIGKWVGIWMHARVGGFLNTKAEASLVFAGTIASVGDTSNGMTVIEVIEARDKIQNATLMTDQLVGRITEGITLRTGMVFTATDVLGGATSHSTTLSVLTGASTNYQVEPGLYTNSEFASILNAWFGQAKTDGNLNFTWVYQPAVTTAGGIRGRFSFEHSTTNVQKYTNFVCNSKYPLTFMGWNFVSVGVTSSEYASKTWDAISPAEPYRLLFENTPSVMARVTLTDSAGTFFDNASLLPSSLGNYWDLSPYGIASSTTNWGVFKMSSGAHVLAHKESATAYTVWSNAGLRKLGTETWDAALTDGLLYSAEGSLTMTQVFLGEGLLVDLLTKFLASTGDATYNGDYDVLPEQLGLAIPWELLDVGWTNSLNALGSQSASQSILVYLDKPKKLWDAVKSDLLLRRASLIWRGTGGAGSGGIAIATWSTPTATTATWDLTESNKTSPASTVDPQRTVSQLSDEYCYNTLKIEYNRDLGGNYHDSLTIVDRAAISDGERVITVQCPNSFAKQTATGQGVEALAAGAAAWLPMFARPVRKIRRSIGIEHALTMSPGDVANVTDNFARDPSTGIRSLTAVPALIVSVSIDWGGANPDGGTPRDFVGEVDLVLEPGRRFAPYSPTAEVDHGAAGGGYNAGTKVVTFLAHAHSETTQATDVSNFAIGDKVRIVEIDPSNAAAPDTWSDTIAAIGTNTATLTTGLAGFSSAKYYRMISEVYTTAVSTQKSDVYQADDADGLISSLAQAYQYAYGTGAATWTATTVSQPVSLYSSYSYGNGAPLEVGYERDVAELANNLVNYRTAPVAPSLQATSIVASSSTYQRQILHIMPFFVGKGTYSARKRLISIAPFARNTQASTKHIYVTFSRFPPTGSSLIWTTAALPEYTIPSPSQVLTFTLGASAGWAALTAQTLDCRIANDKGFGYLIMEGEKGIETRGYARLDLGPLVNQ